MSHLFYYTPDLNLPAPESHTSTVSNGADPEPVVDWMNEVNSVMDFLHESIEQLIPHPGWLPDFEDEDVPIDDMVLSDSELNYQETGLFEQSGLNPNWVSNVGWEGLATPEVVLDIHNLEMNLDEAYGGGYMNEVDELFPIQAFETLFAQLTENEGVLPSASRAVVNNLDSVVITQQDFEGDNVICAVCTDEMNVGDIAKQLPCFHRYHGDCIVPWLVIRNTCPVCRYELPTNES